MLDHKKLLKVFHYDSMFEFLYGERERQNRLVLDSITANGLVAPGTSVNGPCTWPADWRTPVKVRTMLPAL